MFSARSVQSRNVEVIRELYLPLVWPRLDHAAQLWSQYYKMEINLFESIQKRITKMIHGLYNFPCETENAEFAVK